MLSEKEIESRLNALDNWVFVSDKKKYIKELRSIIKKDESLRVILEVVSPETSDNGLVVVSDKKVYFIMVINGRTARLKINNDSINEIKYEKIRNAINLIIYHDGKHTSFKTFSKERSVKECIKAIYILKGIENDDIKADIVLHNDGTTHPVYETDKTNFLDDLTDYFRSISLPGFLDKLDESNKEIEKLKNNDNLVQDIANLNFLFKEAKHVNAVVEQTITAIPDENLKKALINDLVVLSSLCSIADGTLSDEELVLIALVIMPLNPHNSEAVAKAVKEIFYYDSFPLHYKAELLDFWNEISRYMNEENISIDKNSLRSLPLLHNYDKKHNTRHFDKVSTVFYRYSQCLMKADGTINEIEEERLKQINELVHSEGSKASELTEEEKEETLEEVMEKINKLIGMKNIKDQIDTLINLIKVQKERNERGLPITPLSLHAVFYGPPGTGKTTIARLLGKVYRCLGLLEKGHLIETDRAGLVAGYVGQTAIKVDEIVQKSLDGILFIDEAYTLSPEDGGKDFGQEAIDTILKRMEDYRERLVVIVAGYPDEMKRFIFSNPGLKSRFSRYFYFDHYSPEELIQIFDIFAKNVQFVIDEEARNSLLALLEELYTVRTKSFGNGRLVRNIFEKIVEQQANRIASITPLTDEILCNITSEDIPKIEQIRV